MHQQNIELRKLAKDAVGYAGQAQAVMLQKTTTGG